jgi:glycosyltransferase involved in cell wall biosynthesis
MALRFSIVLPNFNSGEVLERAVRSLISQNYPNLQLIVADAGSDDSSSEIIESYKEYFDIIIREKDKGQADGLNRGFTRADGDVFGWLCSDDELLPGALLHVAELFENHPETDVVTGGCERIYEDGSKELTFPYLDTWERIGLQNMIEQPSTFWRSGLHRRLGPLSLDYHLGFDWDFWAKMAKAGARLATTDRVLSRYYFSGDNKCSKAGNLFAEEAFRIIRKHGPFWGGIAYVYNFIYHHFDLKGCCDKPPTSSGARLFFYWLTCAILERTVGGKYVGMYNWHFASCQQRGLKWHS